PRAAGLYWHICTTSPLPPIRPGAARVENQKLHKTPWHRAEPLRRSGRLGPHTCSSRRCSPPPASPPIVLISLPPAVRRPIDQARGPATSGANPAQQPRRPDGPPRRHSDDDALRQGPQEPRPAPELHPGRLHGLWHLTQLLAIASNAYSIKC